MCAVVFISSGDCRAGVWCTFLAWQRRLLCPCRTRPLSSLQCDSGPFQDVFGAVPQGPRSVRRLPVSCVPASLNGVSWSFVAFELLGCSWKLPGAPLPWTLCPLPPALPVRSLKLELPLRQWDCVCELCFLVVSRKLGKM